MCRLPLSYSVVSCNHSNSCALTLHIFFFACRITVSNETQTDAKAPRSNVFITLELRQQSESMALNFTCQFTIAAILFVSAQDGVED